MKAFEYAAPRSEAEVLDFLASQPGQTEILAGGTDLVGLLKKMVVTPDRVVNIMDIPSLKVIEPQSDGSLVIGATVTLDDLLASKHLEPYRAVTDAILGINSMQLQCQGTIGGELCQRPGCWYFRNGHGLLSDDGRAVSEGDNRFHAIFGNDGPAKFVSSSRLAPGLIALDAEVRVLGPTADRERRQPLAQLYRTPRHAGQRELTLAPNEWITHVILPPAAGRLSATYEVRAGAGPEAPLTAAAVTLTRRAGVVQAARVVLGHVAPQPWVAQAAADLLIGTQPDEAVAAAAGKAAVASARPLSNNAYKIQLAEVAVKRATLLAAGFETGGF